MQQHKELAYQYELALHNQYTVRKAAWNGTMKQRVLQTRLKFIEEEFGIVEEPDTTLTRLLDGLRLSEETLHKLMKQPPLIERI